jgi:hypothetical protein
LNVQVFYVRYMLDCTSFYVVVLLICFKFIHGLPKTMKSNIFHYNLEAMRKPMDTYTLNFVNTYKILVLYWPQSTLDDF